MRMSAFEDPPVRIGQTPPPLTADVFYGQPQSKQCNIFEGLAA